MKLIISGLLLAAIWLSLFLLAGIAEANTAQGAPVTGLYWNAEQSGRGFPIDYQNGLLAVTGYVYDDDGNALWFLAAGRMTENGTRLVAPMNVFADGQCLGCPYQSPEVVDTLGTLDIKFSTPDRATMVLGSFETIDIERQNFGFGPAPQSMLGRWYVIVERGTRNVPGGQYIFSELAAPSGQPGGTGIFLDRVARASGECYESGDLAGLCVLFQFDAQNTIQNVFLFEQRTDRLFGVEVDRNTLEVIGRLTGLQLEAQSLQPRSASIKSRAATINSLGLADYFRLAIEQTAPTGELYNRR